MRARNPSAPGASAPQQPQAKPKPATTPSGLAGRLQQVQGQMKPGAPRGARPTPTGATGAAQKNLPRMGGRGMESQTEVLNAPSAPGAPPQLPRNLRNAVAGGMDPQVAMQRAMQNRAGFRDRMSAAAPMQPPPGPAQNLGPMGVAGSLEGGMGGSPTPSQAGPGAPDMPGGPMQLQSFPMPQGGPQPGGYGNDMQAKPMPSGFRDGNELSSMNPQQIEQARQYFSRMGQGGQQSPPGANPALAQHIQQIQGQGGQVPGGLQGAMAQMGGDPRMAPPGGAQGDPRAMAAQLGARMNPQMFQQFLAQQQGQGPQDGMAGAGLGLDAFYR